MGGAGEMALLARFLLSNLGTCIQTLGIHFKSLAWLCVSVIAAGKGGRADLLANLASWCALGSVKEPISKVKWLEERIQCPPLVSTHTHTHCCLVPHLCCALSLCWDCLFHLCPSSNRPVPSVSHRLSPGGSSVSLKLHTFQIA